VLLLAACAGPAGHGFSPSGDTPRAASATRFFRVVQEDGKYWFAAPPDGRRFLSMGIDCVLPGDWSPDPKSPKYHGGDVRGGEPAWAAFTAKRMTEWGFNTVGAWSARSMERRGIPYCAYLWLGVGASHRLVDVWDPGYALRVDEEAAKQMADRSPEDPDLIGWFIDNELPWYGAAGWRTDDPRTLLDLYLTLSATAPGRVRAEAMKARGADEFAGEVARRFLAVTSAAIRKRDPNHLLLGVRFANGAPGPVVRAVGEACDVVSLNWYIKDGRPDPGFLDWFWLQGRKPVLITEFSYRATENRSGLKNSRGADVTVPTQAERARRYTRYVETLAALPQTIGFHWFQNADQPTRGRFDGEDCNYGLVDQADEPYEPLRSAMAAMNARVADLHAKSPLGLPPASGGARPRPPLPVAGVDVLPEWGKRPFPGAVWADYARDAAAGRTWGDEASRCGCAFVKRMDSAVFSFTAGPGWGCGVTVNGPGTGPVDVAGATRLVVEARVTKGLVFNLSLSEDGVAPLEATSFAGSRGADGEQYASGDLAGTGARERYVVELARLGASGGFGNPSGNARLDAQALARVEIHVGGGRGAGEIGLFRVRFE